MYDQLYDAWLREKENTELQVLPKDFYAKLAEYMGRIRQEGRMLDQKTAKAKLVSRELSNAKRLMEELAELRFRKIVDCTTSSIAVEREALTDEEERILFGMKPLVESYRSFLNEFLRGKIARIERTEQSKRVLLRFLKEAPALVGADLKVYGPFKVEDVATLPAENAKVLTKQGVAMEIETK